VARDSRANTPLPFVNGHRSDDKDGVTWKLSFFTSDGKYQVWVCFRALLIIGPPEQDTLNTAQDIYPWLLSLSLPALANVSENREGRIGWLPNGIPTAVYISILVLSSVAHAPLQDWLARWRRSSSKTSSCCFSRPTFRRSTM
jgi:hypothetical protein